MPLIDFTLQYLKPDRSGDFDVYRLPLFLFKLEYVDDGIDGELTLYLGKMKIFRSFDSDTLHSKFKRFFIGVKRALLDDFYSLKFFLQHDLPV